MVVGAQLLQLHDADGPAAWADNSRALIDVIVYYWRPGPLAVRNYAGTGKDHDGPVTALDAVDIVAVSRVNVSAAPRASLE